MKRRHRSAFVIAAFLLSTPLLIAQTSEEDALRRSIQIGVVGGWGWSEHRGAFDGGRPAGRIENGAGAGIAAGVSMTLRPDSGGSWSINPSVTYEKRPGETRRKDPSVLVPFPEDIDDTLDLRTSSIFYTVINVEVLFAQELMRRGGWGLNVEAGPAFQYAVRGQVWQTFSPAGGPGIAQGVEMRPEEMTARFSIKGGISAEIPLAGPLSLAPGIFYDYGLGGGGDDWNVSTLFALAELRVRL